MKLGLIHGAFDPPHAGHLQIARAAARLCDRLTILIHRSDEEARVELALRQKWMSELVPGAIVVSMPDEVPGAPTDIESAQRWRDIVASVHPEPVDMLFAGDKESELLATALGARFVPLGNRVLDIDKRALGNLKSREVRADPFSYWRFLPGKVRAYFAPTIVLHGVESVGKSMMGARLAWLYDTLIVGEFGRADCIVHGNACEIPDLERMGSAQSAMIEEARPWCHERLFADTDALMTIAWARMMHGREPDSLWAHPRGNLYLLLEPDVPFVEDGVRMYGDEAERRRFHAIAEKVLSDAGVQVAVVSGAQWEGRFEKAVSAIDLLSPRR